MQKIPKQEYTVEFKAQAVKRVKDGKTVGTVAKEMGLVEQTLRHWVKASMPASAMARAQMERSRLRAENLRLKREIDLLKKATVSFARDAR
jgi:transposase